MLTKASFGEEDYNGQIENLNTNVSKSFINHMVVNFEREREREAALQDLSKI